MHSRRTTILLLTSLVAVACNTRLRRADSTPSSSVQVPEPDQSLLLLAPSVTPSNGAEPPSNGNAAERLPPLKPVIAKPFPEGASQDVVCEAIRSKETDLWARFGHLVPLYMRGAIFVLEAGPSRHQKITHFVTKEYVHPHFPQLASCGDTTLLYISSLAESAEFGGKPFGRVHLSQELERRLGIRTSESFEIVEDQDGLSKYCTTNGDTCDALRRLDITNLARGLCANVKSLCWRQLERSLDALSHFEAECLKIPKRELACIEAAEAGPALRACEENLQHQICP